MTIATLTRNQKHGWGYATDHHGHHWATVQIYGTNPRPHCNACRQPINVGWVRKIPSTTYLCLDCVEVRPCTTT